MKSYTYLIIGGGMAANAAVEGIRGEDEKGSIGILTAESFPPYDRPPLSKGLWTGDTEEEKIVHHLEKQDNVTVHQDCVVAKISPNEQTVTDEEDNHYSYQHLLLATGGTPKKLPFDNGQQVIYYRTLADYQHLEKLSQKYDHFAVIGGGFIGSEIAAALAMIDKKVTLVFPEKGVCAKLFPSDLSDHITQTYRDKGVTIKQETKVKAISGELGNFALQTESGDEIHADVIIAGIGIDPNTQLAVDAGLEVDDGVVVDEKLRTSAPNIYAAGDMAAFIDPVLQKRRRVEHEDNAMTMGKIAGRVMAGADASYQHSPMFYSDMFDMGYEAVGQLDSSLNIVYDWETRFEKGVIYYLDGDQICGVLLWNVWDEVETARELIAKGEHVQPENVIGSIGNWEPQDQLLKETFPASDPLPNW